jgi:hypothetical protein
VDCRISLQILQATAKDAGGIKNSELSARGGEGGYWDVFPAIGRVTGALRAP